MNLNNIKANIDAAIDAGLGIGGILAANHNNVLTETLFGAGRYTGFFYTASGDLSGNAPTGFFLWNGNDPSNLAPFVVRAAELNIDLQDLGEVLAILNAGDIITLKDVEGRFFQLVFQSFVAGVDGAANNIYDITVTGVASNSNYIYGPAETQTAGLGFITAGGGGGGGQVNTVQSGEGITIDATDPINPIANLGGTIDQNVQIDVTELPAGFLTIAGINAAADIDTTFEVDPTGAVNVNIEDSGSGGGGGFAGISAFIFGGQGQVTLEVGIDDGVDTLNQAVQLYGGALPKALNIKSEDTTTGDLTAIRMLPDELRLVTPNVDNLTAIVGQVLTLQAVGGEVEFQTLPTLTTLYSGNGTLAGARAVDLGGNELQFTEGGNIIYFNNGRVGVGTPVFGGSRLGDSELQATNIDLQTLNFKDAGQLTALAMFFTKVPGVGVDGYVTSMKNFVDDVNVISVDGVGNATFGGVARQVEATLGLRNDFTGGEFRVFDTFNNDYDAPTDVAEAQGWVAIHGGGATAKKIGLWRYDTVTYDNIFQVSATTSVITLSKQVDVSGILRAFSGLRIQGGGVSNTIQMDDVPASSFAAPTRNLIFWDASKFSIQPLTISNVSAQFDLSALTAVRQITVPDADVEIGLDANAIHDNVANEISGIAAKALPVAGDLIIIEDSAAGFVKKSVDIANLPGGGGVSQAVGTFTPVPQQNPGTPGWGGIAFAPGATGNYIRIGDAVHFDIDFPSILGSGGVGLAGITVLEVGGLPFNSANAQEVYGIIAVTGGVTNGVVDPGQYCQLKAYHLTGTRIGVQVQELAGNLANTWDNVSFPVGSNVRISGTYYTTDP